MISLQIQNNVSTTKIHSSGLVIAFHCWLSRFPCTLRPLFNKRINYSLVIEYFWPHFSSLPRTPYGWQIFIELLHRLFRQHHNRIQTLNWPSEIFILPIKFKRYNETISNFCNPFRCFFLRVSENQFVFQVNRRRANSRYRRYTQHIKSIQRETGQRMAMTLDT